MNSHSVLDDNKLLTLPNGERLNLPPNVRIMFEVEHLRFATLATVSRYGMIWFSDDVVEPSMVYKHYLDTLSNVPLDAEDDDPFDAPARLGDVVAKENSTTSKLTTRRQVASILEPFF